MKRILCVFILFALPVFAQTDRANLTGTIVDVTGSRIPNASVQVQSLSTGLTRSTKASGFGVYSLNALPVGHYSVEVSAHGFQSIRVPDLSLNVGQTRTLNLKMTVVRVSSKVRVVADGSDLDKTSATIGGVVHGSQIRELPLNGRNWVSLMSLTPGVIDSGSGTEKSMRFAGLSDEDNVYQLDGIDMSGINHQYQKENIRLQVSTAAIAEFRANSAVYSADQGGAPGGQMELVSRSGTNVVHGSVWEFLRNSAFDATPWSYQSLPPLHLNDFGANLGGPVIRNKLFYFVNYEGLRQVLDQQLFGYVPSQSFRNAALTQSPGLAPILNAYPKGTEPDPNNPQNIDLWYGGGRQVQNEDSGLARIDYQIDPSTSVSLRFDTDAYTLVAPQGAGSGTYLTDTGFTDLSTPNAMVELQHTFSPTIMNDIRYGFNRANFLQGQNTALPIAVSVNGLSSLSNPSGSTRVDNTFNFLDDATFVVRRHTIKAGVQIRRIQENKASPSTPDQSISYVSLQDFKDNLIDTDSYNGAVPVTGQRMTEYFGYILDQYQMRPNLTWNVGLRYEYYGVDHEVLGRGVVVDPLTCPNVICPAGTPWYHPNLLDFEPRVSVTWSPYAFRNKTVIRAGFGIYDGPGQFGNLGAPVGNIAEAKYTLTQVEAPGLSYPLGPYTGAISSSFSPAGRPRNRKDVSADEWTLSIQHELPGRMVAQIAYLGTEDSHVFSRWTLNGVNPATGKRPYAGFSTIDYRGTFNHASMNALQLGLRRSMSGGLLIAASYQWSHAINNGGIGGGEADIPENLACLRCERASSDEDIRSYFTASGIWQLPVGRGHAVLGNAPRWLNEMLGRWQLSGIAFARSGLPVNVTMSRPTKALPDQLNKNQRPNLVPGVPLYPHHRTPENWLNPAAFSVPADGTWGDAPRNVVRAPGIWQLDSALEKHFPLYKRLQLSFRAEAFNVFNRAQYGSPNSTWAPPTATSSNPTSYGVITGPFNTSPTGTGTPREIQFMMKLQF